MLDSLLKKIASSANPFTLVMFSISTVIISDFDFMKEFIQEHARPQLCFVFVCMGAMYESISIDTRKSSDKIDGLALQMKVQSLKGAVNSMYSRFERSGEEFITNEDTIRELAELTDLLEKLKVNSYTQNKIKKLNSKVKL